MAYWDTSCVLKLYVYETDSEEYIARAACSAGPIYCSSLIHTELYYALRCKEIAGDIKSNAAEDLFDAFLKDWSIGRFVLIPLSDDIQDLARDALKVCLTLVTPILLRSLDGLHLASALAANQTEIVTADRRMQQAARALGLKS